MCGATVTKYWKPNATHVIAATDAQGACTRTLKVLMTILNGRWILKIDWVKACMEAIHPVDEEPYEVDLNNHGSCNGPKTDRLMGLDNIKFADSIEAARKDPGEYWVSVMKDEPMPEALQGLLPLDSSPSQPNKNANCHTSMGARTKDQVLVEYFELENGKPFVKNFKPRPNYVEYYSKDNVGRETEKKYVRDFKPRPNYVEYYSKDDVGGQTKKSFVRDFELKSNKDDDGPEVQRLYEKEIETTPDHTNYIYHE